MKTKRVGIMGGSFDPIHNGHLIISERAKEQFGLDKIIFIPTGNPPHKKSYEMSSVDDRYSMTKLAIEENESYLISDIEAKSSDTTYTVNTLRTISEENEDYDLYFILGADSFIDISNWKDYKEILENYKIIVAKRPVLEDINFNKVYRRHKIDYPESIFLLDSPTVGISSTYIREVKMKEESIRYMIPEKVNDYIIEKCLYKKR